MIFVKSSTSCLSFVLRNSLVFRIDKLFPISSRKAVNSQDNPTKRHKNEALTKTEKYVVTLRIDSAITYPVGVFQLNGKLIHKNIEKLFFFSHPFIYFLVLFIETIVCAYLIGIGRKNDSCFKSKTA